MFVEVLAYTSWTGFLSDINTLSRVTGGEGAATVIPRQEPKTRSILLTFKNAMKKNQSIFGVISNPIFFLA